MAIGNFQYRSSTRRLLLGAIVFAVISTLAFAQSRSQTKQDLLNREQLLRRERSLAHIERAALDGDLIFRSGRDMVSTLILSQSNTPQYSHVGVIVKHDGHTWVVHAIPSEEGQPNGVLEDTLADFASQDNASGFGLYSPKELNASHQAAVHYYARKQKGKPFDDTFFLTDDQRMYCTELAVKSYQFAGINLSANIVKNEIMTLTEPVIVPDALAGAPELRPIMLYREETEISVD